MKRIHEVVLNQVRQAVPQLKKQLHKGQCGRVGVVGGSFEYTGAPYFAAISALYTGADLGYIFCTQGAATAIKSYSPEIIVLPVLRTSQENTNGTSPIEIANNIAEKMKPLHSLVIGPGLGRDDCVQETAKRIIEIARAMSLPLIIDGDGLWAVSEDPSIIHGYESAILTPNVAEYSRLCKKVLGAEPDAQDDDPSASVKKLAAALGNVTILKKGAVDIISNGQNVVSCDQEGGARRCSGQGDVLAGTVGTFAAWLNSNSADYESITSSDPSTIGVLPKMMLAAFGGSTLTRACSKQAFAIHARSVTTTRLIEHISDAFTNIFESADTLQLIQQAKSNL